MNKDLETTLNTDVRRISQENITSIEPLADSGEVNQVFLVTTSNEKYVARVNNKEELLRFRKEEWCISHATRVGVIGPRVQAVGSQGGTAYMLLEYIEGLRADKKSIDQTAVWRTLGRYAKQIHSVAVNGFGEELSDFTNGTLGKWNEYLNYNINSLDNGDDLQKRGVITQVQAAQIKNYFERLLYVQFNFGLSHGDLSLNNAIVDNNNVVNLIDWGSAAAHVVPHYDLGVILTDSISEDSDEFKNVLNGYGLEVEDFGKIREGVMSLMLLIAIDKVRWAIDRSPSSVDSAVEHFNRVFAWKTGSSLSSLTK